MNESLKSIIFKRAATPASDDDWGRSGWQVRFLLHALTFTGTAVALGAVSWASGGDRLYVFLAAAVGLGHCVSARWTQRKLRLDLVIYPATLLLAWTMRAELLVIVTGGSLFLMAKLLAVFQTMTSFNLRSLHSLYDSFLLSLVVILLASEAALTPLFAVFIFAFVLVALIFLAAANPISESTGMRRWSSTRMQGLAIAVPGIVLLTFIVSVGVFLVVPQAYLLQDASPLPSRLDLTVGRPVAPAPLLPGDAVPSSGFLPSGEADSAVEMPDVASAGYATLGYAGEREDDIVMYVRSPIASFWRGLVLDEYDGRGWKTIDAASQIEVGRFGRLQFRDAPPRELDVRRYVQTFFPRVTQPDAVFTGYSPGYIALLDAPGEVSFSAGVPQTIQRLREARSYSVTSAVPGLTPAQLILDSVNTSYLEGRQFPAVSQRVENLANAIVAGSTSDFQMAARLEQYLLVNYQYDLGVPPLSPFSDVVDNFLFERQAGYCAQFATAMAVMARLVGLPARVAMGYVPGVYNSLTGAHTVRLQDAHAWVEIDFIEQGWVAFDPTPRPDSPWALDAGFTNATRTLQDAMRGQFAGWLRVVPTAATGAVVAVTSVDGLPGVALTLSVAFVLVALWVSIAKLGLRRARTEHGNGYRLLGGAARGEAVRAYLRALRLMRRRGYPKRQAHESPADYVTKLESQDFLVPNTFRRISRLATCALYDPAPLDSGIVHEGWRLLKTLRAIPKLT